MWEDNIKINHRETWCEGVEWITEDQCKAKWRTYANAVMNLYVS
jgi:hypothetical protein